MTTIQTGQPRITDSSILSRTKSHQEKLDDLRKTANGKPRDNFCIAFIGTNRTGKTSTAKKMAEIWRANNPQGRIVSYDPQENFKNLSDDFIEYHDDNWGAKLLSLRNCLLVLDDYRLIHQKNMVMKELAILLSFRAQWNVDIIYICHSPALVLNHLTYYTSHYYIFKTMSLEDSFAKKIPNYELCIEANALINTYVAANGKGTWPNFPHIIVDCGEEKLIPQNVDKVKFQTATAQVKGLKKK